MIKSMILCFVLVMAILNIIKEGYRLYSALKNEEKYLIAIIKQYSDNEDIIGDIFIVISNRSKEGKIKCIIELLSANNNYEMFEKIQLESYNWSWSGSEIPVIENRIDYFKELLKNIEQLGTSYIKHCLLVNDKIKSLERYKIRTIRTEFLNDW